MLIGVAKLVLLNILIALFNQAYSVVTGLPFPYDANKTTRWTNF